MQISNDRQMLVSIVIPVYNRINTIRRSVKSVLNQTYKNIEVIIVDDGSTDGTREILKKLEKTEDKVKVFIQNHKGANAARNLGIRKSKGKFIAFQDSDDEWLVDKLEQQITYMVKNYYEICYCPYLLYKGKSREVIPNDYKNKQKYERDLIKVLRCHNVISTQTLVICRNIILDVGIFDEEMSRYQDYEYVIRLIQRKKIAYINRPLVKVYRTKNSISNDDKKGKESELKLLIKHQSFFDIKSCLKNKLKEYIYTLNELEWSKKLDYIDNIMKVHLNDQLIDIYKIANEILYHEYILQNDFYIKEYEERIKHLYSYKFAIYGAGKVGEKIFLELSKKDLIPQCFLVTNKSEKNELYGIPILSLEEWEKKDNKVIVGVSLELQNELIKNLIALQYTDYIRYPNRDY